MHSMTFIIESNIPAPTSRHSGWSKYPYAQMKVGDSFAVDGASRDLVANSACAFVRRHQKKWRFSVRKTSTGYRCWRIA